MAIQNISKPAASNVGTGQNYTVALSTLTILFFMMGFITCLNDILIPYLKNVFSLSYTQANLINLCFFGAYFFMSIPSGIVVEKLGYKAGMILGFMITALGAFLFYPAADYRVYGLFLGALFILATGITLLQVAGNPYVSVLGKPDSASARLTLTQAFNSLGTTIAPVLGTALILSNLPAMTGTIDPSAIDIGAVQRPYIIIGIVLVVIAFILGVMKLPVIKHESSDYTNATAVDRGNALKYPHLLFGVIGIFTYVGAEVAIGSHIVNYLELPAVMSLSAVEAGNFVAFYWGSAMVGRFIGSYILKRNEYSKGTLVGMTILYAFAGYALLNIILVVLGKLTISQGINFTLIFSSFAILASFINTFVLNFSKPSQTLTYNAVLSVILILVSIVTTGYVSMFSILLVGFLNSIMFPTIFTLAVSNLGKYTDQASSYLCTAIVGGAIIPLAYGALTDFTNNNSSLPGLKVAFILPILCYLYIGWYGMKGYQHK